MTPMQEQYYRIKEKYPDTILLFRLGDFYEAFNDDAKTLSRVLGITLTGRGKNDNRTPMAGIPYHALHTYMPKMVEANLKVAIADQMTEPVAGKLVEREITKIITPGTVIDENSLDISKNNFIASIYCLEHKKFGKIFSFVLCDITTGELRAFTTPYISTLENEIQKFSPAEILVQRSQKDIFKDLSFYLEFIEEVSIDSAIKILEDQFSVQNLRGFGIEPLDKVFDNKSFTSNTIVIAASSLIKYLKECQRGEINHIKGIKIYGYEDYMQLDSETIRNLELLYSNNSARGTTLYDVLNFCATPMGQRKLRRWIITPLINEMQLEKRLGVVELFYSNRILADKFRDQFGRISDIERIVGRIGLKSANPKDLVAIKNSCQIFLDLNSDFEKEDLLLHFTKGVEASLISSVVSIISRSLDDDPSALLNQGNVIREGYNAEIDELRALRRDVKQILLDMQKREIERTQISSLKISYNNVFGYYIEVTKTHLNKVPDDYIRKQTLANAERYITEELKQLETRILSAEEKLLQLESQLFFEVIAEISEYSKPLLALADSIASIDILNNFGEISRHNRYSRPMIRSKNILSIKNGRHPVIEKLVTEFTPNDVNLGDAGYIDIITGPNMSGKSTYIRQVALICLMAQIGCFVPADSMEFSIVDRIFTRVGASDNLSKGESTFMVEMSETANILNNATKRSLVILDEIGRGTSTYDGVAIAWSVVEFIQSKLKAKTLFATHYHELTEMKNQYAGIVNYNVRVLEEDDEIFFTHKIIEGAADRSYGVYVAKIAGIPEEVVARSNEILKRFESQKEHKNDKKLPKSPKKISPEQLDLI